MRTLFIFVMLLTLFGCQKSKLISEINSICSYDLNIKIHDLPKEFIVDELTQSKIRLFKVIIEATLATDYEERIILQKTGPVEIAMVENINSDVIMAFHKNQKISDYKTWSEDEYFRVDDNQKRFQDRGTKYIGFRINSEEETKYGWISLDISKYTNPSLADTINRVFAFATTCLGEVDLYAGQKDSTMEFEIDSRIPDTVRTKIDVQLDNEVYTTEEILLNLDNSFKLNFSVNTGETGNRNCILAHESSLEVLDNSHFGYPDPLLRGEIVDGNSNWLVRNTFNLASSNSSIGRFKGKGLRFLGIRVKKDDGYKYGWISISVDSACKMLWITDFMINHNLDQPIITGQ